MEFCRRLVCGDARWDTRDVVWQTKDGIWMAVFALISKMKGKDQARTKVQPTFQLERVSRSLPDMVVFRCA